MLYEAAPLVLKLFELVNQPPCVSFYLVAFQLTLRVNIQKNN